MAFAQLSIDLVAKVASFETDLKRVAASTEAQSNRMASALGLVKSGLAGFAAGLSIGALTTFIKGVNDSVDALNDVADATGASIENISALQEVALRTGTSMDTVSTALVKFNQVLNAADPDSKAAKALEQIGLNAEELKRIDPAEALRLTAVALSKFADDGDKARLVQELFGKSVKDVAPLLKDLAEQGELVATVTAQQALEAEKFNKELFKLQATAAGLARTFTNDLVTGLNGLIDKFREGSKAGEGFVVTLLRQTEIARLLGLNKVSDDYSTLRDRIALVDSRLKGLNVSEQLRNKLLAERARLQAELDKPLTGERLNSRTDPRSLGLPSIDLQDSGNPAAKKGRTGSARAGKSEAERAAEQELKLQRDVAQLYADRRNAEREAENKAVEENIKASEREAEEQYRIALKASQDRQALRNAEYELVIEQVRKNAEDAERLIKDNADAIGDAFGKAFEDAIVGGEKFSDVLKGLAEDVSRLVLRKTVTEPLSDQISGILRGTGSSGGGVFSDLFGSIFGFAKGGDHRGGLRIVGENGPELEATGPSRIFTADQTKRMLSGGGGSVVNNFTIQGPVDRRSEAQIAKAAQRGLQRAQRWL
jgi:hypothetical protein